MKKLFVFLLAMVIMCLFTCNTAATEAVVEMTRYYQAIQDADNIVISNAQNGKYSMYMAFRTCTRHYAGDSSIILCH